MSTGLVAKPAGIAVPWTMPPTFPDTWRQEENFRRGHAAINIVVSFVVYYPFFRMWDKQKLKEENELEPVKRLQVR